MGTMRGINFLRMNITKIEKKDGLYFVTKTPNFIERYLGIVETTDRFKDSGDVFHHFPHIKVFYQSNGKVLSWDSEMCNILNEYVNSF
jgi:hypothetical protein